MSDLSFENLNYLHRDDQKSSDDTIYTLSISSNTDISEEDYCNTLLECNEGSFLNRAINSTSNESFGFKMGKKIYDSIKDFTQSPEAIMAMNNAKKFAKDKNKTFATTGEISFCTQKVHQQFKHVTNMRFNIASCTGVSIYTAETDAKSGTKRLLGILSSLLLATVTAIGVSKLGKKAGIYAGKKINNYVATNSSKIGKIAKDKITSLDPTDNKMKALGKIGGFVTKQTVSSRPVGMITGELSKHTGKMLGAGVGSAIGGGIGKEVGERAFGTIAGANNKKKGRSILYSWVFFKSKSGKIVPKRFATVYIASTK